MIWVGEALADSVKNKRMQALKHPKINWKISQAFFHKAQNNLKEREVPTFLLANKTKSLMYVAIISLI